MRNTVGSLAAPGQQRGDHQNSLALSLCNCMSQQKTYWPRPSQPCGDCRGPAAWTASSMRTSRRTAAPYDEGNMLMRNGRLENTGCGCQCLWLPGQVRMCTVTQAMRGVAVRVASALCRCRLTWCSWRPLQARQTHPRSRWRYPSAQAQFCSSATLVTTLLGRLAPSARSAGLAFGSPQVACTLLLPQPIS